MEPGKFEIQVGTSSDEIYYKLPVWVGNKPISFRGKQFVKSPVITTGKIIRIEGIVRDVQATPIAGVKVKTINSEEEVMTDAKDLIPYQHIQMIFSCSPKKAMRAKSTDKRTT